MGFGLFDSCKTSCVKRLDQDGDGKISRQEFVIAGKKVVGYMLNLLTVASTSANKISEIWGVDISEFNKIATALNGHLQDAQDVLSKIKNFPSLPKNITELKTALDTNGDGNVSAVEVSDFLTKVHGAFKEAELYCLKHNIPFAPVQACSETIENMIKTFQVIQEAAATAAATKKADDAARETMPSITIM